MANPFQEHITILGETMGRQKGKCFGINQSDRLYHMIIMGQTGVGKSTLLFNLARQDLEQGQGFCLIDPHGDLAEQLKPLLDNKAIYWDLADPECVYGYNPLGHVSKRYRSLVASGLIEALKNQWSDAWGVRMEHLLRHAVLALLEYPNSSLKDIVPMFTDKHFRAKVLDKVTDKEVLKFWRDEFANMNYKNAIDGVAPIANKLGAFLANPLIRCALTYPEHPLRFRQLMDEGTPLVINLAKGKLGADITNVMGGLIVSMLAQAALSRADIAEHPRPSPNGASRYAIAQHSMQDNLQRINGNVQRINGKRVRISLRRQSSKKRRAYLLYADEFHAFTTESFAGMLSELRKYKLGLVLANQHCSQIKPAVLESILGNVGTQIIFRLGAKDATLMAKQLAGHTRRWTGGIEPADLINLPNYQTLINLPNYQTLIKLMIKGEQSKVFSGRMVGSQGS